MVLCNERFREVNKAVANLLPPGTSYQAFLRSGVEKGCFPEAVGGEEEWIAARLHRHQNPSGLFEMRREDGLWLLIDEQRMPNGGIVSIATDITKQKRAEEALRDSETRFRQHASATSDWLWEIDAARRYTFISDIMEDKVGRTPNQYLGTTVDSNIDELYNRDDWQPFLDAFEAREPIRDLTVKRRDPNGTEQWIRTSGVPFYADDGEFLGFRGSASDVTEHVMAEKQLANLTAAIDKKSEIVVLYDPDDRLVFCNDTFREVNKDVADLIRPGVTFEALTRAGLERGLIPEAVGREAAWLQERLVRHRNPKGPVEQDRQGGVWHLIQEQRLDDGSIVSIVSDITDRKRAEEALAASEARFRAVFDHAPSAIALKDRNGRYELVNRTYENFFEIAGEDILGKTSADLFPADIAARLEKRDRSIMDNRKTEVYESSVSNPGLEMSFVRMIKFPVFDQFGALTGVGSFANDISAEKAAEERLIQSQKMEAVGQLTGGIAHEFNNLLQVVAGNIELLADDIPRNTDGDQSIQAIRRNVTRGADLTSRLLSFSRRQPLTPKALVTQDILHGMQDLLGRTLAETIEIRVAVMDNVWLAEADPGQLENALLNLALNARDAMPNGGVITISADNIRIDMGMAAQHEEATAGDYVVLSVTDSGTGMTEDEINRAFEPFFTTKDIGKGTGLGLSMVYGFAQQSGGFVEIDSAPGHGTTMRLYLPRISGPGAGGTAIAEVSRAHPSAMGGTILLVEDDTDVRVSLAAQLKSLDYRVIEAQSGVAALAALNNGPRIDLLFTDIVMPGGLSGLELARQIILLRPGLKVLYTTGYSDEVIADSEQMEDGAVILRKPYDKTKLAATISQLLD